MTFYSTLAAGQIGYIAGDCDARIAVLDGAQELARWRPVPASTVRAAAACPADDQNPPPVRYLAMYQVAWAGLRICMSRAHKRRTRERRYGHRPGQPRLGRVAGPQGKAPCP